MITEGGVAGKDGANGIERGGGPPLKRKAVEDDLARPSMDGLKKVARKLDFN